MHTSKNIALSQLISISLLGILLQGCSSEEPAPLGDISTEEAKVPQDAFDQGKFKLVKWKADRAPVIPEITFSLEPKSDTCTYEVKLRAFSRFSNTFLKKNKLRQKWSPIRILENNQPLKPNIPREKFEGKECIGSSFSAWETIIYSPTSDSVQASSLKLGLDTSMPIETADGPVYWLFKDVGYNAKIKRGTVGNGETVTLTISVDHYGKISRKPRLFVQNKAYTFEESSRGIVTAKIPLKNDGIKLQIRMRFFNHARIQEVSVSSDTTTVYLIESPKRN